MRKWIWLLLCTFSLWLTGANAAGNAVLLEIDGAISPSVVDYIVRGIGTAAEKNAKVVIIQLNTPGGLETSMRSINQAIIQSSIPIITYVSPSGARAASAGVFIMYASHFAAMAPGTNIGAATPVALMDDGKKEMTNDDTHLKKATNDAAAYLRSLAELRGRNIEWATQAVTDAASLTANEAKKMNVINVVANNIPDVLAAANGKTVLVGHAATTIDADNLTIESIPPDWRSRFLAFLTDPNIAYLLMLAALYGMFFEFSNPGLVLPGVAGVIALILALYAFQLMPVNYVGVTLILLSFAFMAFEISVSTFGVVGVGGIVAFVIGSIMLYDTQDPNFRVAFSLIASMTIITGMFILFAATLMIKAHNKPIITGEEGLLGKEGVVISMHENYILIRVEGELWKAELMGVTEPGHSVKIVKVDGLLLTVKPVDKELLS
jgi:membrane-bound serine protease (ClpP class)